MIPAPALAAAIRAWVQANCTPTTVGGTTVYQLTG
jgi:hypothetical protein